METASRDQLGAWIRGFPRTGLVRFHAVACESQRGLDEAWPGEPAVCAPELAEPGGHARHGARRRTDGVVHELRTERNLEVHELGLARV